MSEAAAIIETLERMFPTPIPADQAQDAWGDLREGGFAWVGTNEALGGSGGDLADAAVIVRTLAAQGVSVPLAESALLGSWLLGAAGIPIDGRTSTTSSFQPSDELALQRGADGWSLQGRLSRVPWLSWVDDLVVLVQSQGTMHIVRIDRAALTVEPGYNLAGEPRDTVVINDLELDGSSVAEAPVGVSAEALRLRGAMARSAAIAGALSTVLEMTVRYTSERVQFGRPISSFQAVQHHLVRLAGEVAQTQVAAERAIAAADSPRFADAVGVAKLIASEAVGPAAAAAHQAHGAIGVTREYDLQIYTRSLWSWRHEFGSARQWADTVGRQVVARGPDALWEMITDTLNEGGFQR